jgi:nucleoside phosphorylase
MNLLTFAHRGEAQHFLKYNNYKSVDFKFSGLFKNEENYLLITGEGLQSTEERMAAFFSHSNLTIDNVINLGIAGALNENFEIDSIHSIKQVFGEDQNQNFISFDENAQHDCISAKNRVLNKSYAKRLSKHASIVDRELWVCAKVCKIKSIPFYSFKIISDYADHNTDSKTIINKSNFYSTKLYNYYKFNLY